MKKAGNTIEKKLRYIQIKEDIEAKIRAQILKPGERLLSEPELAREYRVSRPTLREALKMLQKERMIVSKNGVGTYVNDNHGMIENPLNQLHSLGEMIQNAGYTESAADVVIYRQAPEAEWRQKLSIDEPVVVIERTRTANGRKVAFYYNIFPESIAGDHFGPEFKDAIFRFIETKMQIYITHCITEIAAPSRTNPFDRRAGAILGPEIIVLKQLHFDAQNRPVFYSIDYLKSGSIKLVLKRER